MKYYAICALLLVPLVYGAAVPRTENADVDLVPDMSVASDAYSNAQPSKRHVPPFRFMNEQMENNADIDLIPDMSVAADAEDNEVPEAMSADADLIPDMSVASDGEDQVAALVPDMSVASDAE
ncbi:PREDICTED: uncharacterized protein LOC108614239 isoform X9 [Drosophila arizonae]|uniref:Uncharacterized protein LOC108614239 isoform X9 n=1 Tax=Drosophila arizonae TaxID=7263 RepID=A0ABM1P975_DROAR|nr:PREDICTED: uncharacterized protein LOC108614239 isoform X9 [Drosophila arizonae]